MQRRRINLFCENYFSIDGEEISLRLIDIFYGNENELPYYWWNIVLKSSKENIGKISLRIGHNYHSYYNGNIGYEIDEEYRGNHYAYKACRMLLPVAKHHGMDHLFMSCDYDNTASIKTIERMGANMADELVPPSDYIFYYDGMVKQRIYKLNVE